MHTPSLLLGLTLLLCALAVPAEAAPQIPARLDLGAARIVVEGAPLSGEYLVVCQTDEGPALTGPWALEAGDVAAFPVMRLGSSCWVQVSETREGALMSVWETPRWAVHRVWLGQVGRQP